MKRKASFIGGNVFWDTFLAFRVCWLRGRYGGGKTALAVIMAARLLAEGRVSIVVGNVPTTFSSETVTPLPSAAVLLDEAWMYIERAKDAIDYAGFVRKFEHFLLLPAVFPVHNRLSYFFVQRVFNGYTLGLPVWWYRWGLRQADVKEYGYFGVLHPTAIFNHYPTQYVPGVDGGIADAMVETARLAGYKGTRREQKVASVEMGDISLGQNYDDIVDALDGHVFGMDETLASLESVERKIRSHK